VGRHPLRHRAPILSVTKGARNERIVANMGTWVAVASISEVLLSKHPRKNGPKADPCEHHCMMNSNCCPHEKKKLDKKEKKE